MQQTAWDGDLRGDRIWEPFPNRFLELTDTYSVMPVIHHLSLGPLGVPSCLLLSIRELSGRGTVSTSRCELFQSRGGPKPVYPIRSCWCAERLQK